MASKAAKTAKQTVRFMTKNLATTLHESAREQRLGAGMVAGGATIALGLRQ